MSRESWGMAMAMQNLVWGIAQPFAGAFADRYGTGRTVASGLVVYAARPRAHGDLAQRRMDDAHCRRDHRRRDRHRLLRRGDAGLRPQRARRRSARSIFGIATAASSFGQFAIAPLGQSLISSYGWQQTLIYMALMLLCILPLSFALKGKAALAPGQAEFSAADRAAQGVGLSLLPAAGDRLLRLRLPPRLHQRPHARLPRAVRTLARRSAAGRSRSSASSTSSARCSSGYIGGKYPKQILLASIYFTRAVAIGLFLLFPVTEVSAYVFSAAIGLLWLSTVPPTAGLVSTFFGPRYMGLLYGIAFLSHQLGSFVGVWLGGAAYDMTGSYALVWYLGILLGLASAAVHLPIREAGAAGFQARPATA